MLAQKKMVGSVALRLQYAPLKSEPSGQQPNVMSCSKQHSTVNEFYILPLTEQFPVMDCGFCFKKYQQYHIIKRIHKTIGYFKPGLIVFSFLQGYLG